METVSDTWQHGQMPVRFPSQHLSLPSWLTAEALDSSAPCAGRLAEHRKNEDNACAAGQVENGPQAAEVMCSKKAGGEPEI